MGKINIKKSELDRIIKEEAMKFTKALTLKKEMKNIEEQLKQLNECGVNEVQAGADIESPGKPYEGTMKKAEFHNPAKNPNTMMEDNEDIEDTDIDAADDTDIESDTINKADVLKAIEDLKMALHLHGADEAEEETDSVEDIADGADTDEPNAEEGEEDEIFEFTEEGKEEPKVDENTVQEEVGDKGVKAIEGKSVVQNATEDTTVDNMKKDTHVKEEGEALMETEKKRMAVLAGLIKG